MQLQKGQRVKLGDLIATPVFSLEINYQSGLTIDAACFGLDQNQKLSDDRYMVFYNQKESPCCAVKLNTFNSTHIKFDLNLNLLPTTIERLVFTLAIDGNGTMNQLQQGNVRLLNPNELACFNYSGADFTDERALMLFEIYRKDNIWRMSCTAQGFNGGLARLVEHFGAEVAKTEPPAPTTSPATPVVTTPTPSTTPNKVDTNKRVLLEKRIEQQAPQLVNLVKKVAVTLDKVGLNEHRAKVCLCLDISGSMHLLYEKGLVQKFAERILALGCHFDDDGEIDIFLFGSEVHQPRPMNLSNFATYINQALREHPLEFSTNYGLAIQAIRKFYVPQNQGRDISQATKTELPVYVMFLTDGATADQALTEQQLRSSSYEGIFWQFMGIGAQKKGLFGGGSDFAFLEKLDNLSGRLLDNANFFSVSSPDQYDDEALYQLLMKEYPGWLNQAKNKGLI